MRKPLHLLVIKAILLLLNKTIYNNLQIQRHMAQNMKTSTAKITKEFTPFGLEL